MKPSRSPERLTRWIKILPLFLLFLPQALCAQGPPEGRCVVYPSPASGNSARVVYQLPESGTAHIYVYNEAGDLAAKDRRWNTAGIQQVPLDLTHYRRGVYLCRVVLDLDSGARVNLKSFKFIVVK